MTDRSKLYVVKRNGIKEEISFDKVLYRVKSLCGLDESSINTTFKPLYNVDYNVVSKETIRGIYVGINTKELDDLSACVCQSRSFDHPEYGILSSRIYINNYHKSNIFNLQKHFNIKEELEGSLFLYTACALFENIDDNGNQYPLIDPNIFSIIKQNHDILESIIDYNRDYQYDFMGFKMLEESYLQKCSLNISFDKT